MAAIDPFAPLRDWESSLYRGSQTAIDRFLEETERTLPPGWVRDFEYQRIQQRPDRTICYRFDRAGEASVRLWLTRVNETRVRGGPFQVLRPSATDDAWRIGQMVGQFADGCVLVASRTTGVCRTRPAFGVRSVVSHTAKRKLAQFADLADGAWPLDESTEPAWDDLVSDCLTERVGINRDELERWLVDSGWAPELAPAIVERFYADARWLANRLERMAV